MIALLLTPIDVDGSVRQLHSRPQFQARIERENSKPAPAVFFVRREPLPSLPVVANKPVKRRIVSSGNCVTVVRSAGYYVPQNPKIYAKYLKMDSSSLPPEGEPVVIQTKESWMGHVLVAVNLGGTLVSKVDSQGVGRVIPHELYRGYLEP